jgi:hypothetical protein
VPSPFFSIIIISKACPPGLKRPPWYHTDARLSFNIPGSLNGPSDA